MNRLCVFALCATLASINLGCAKKGERETAVVKGKVTLKGKPVPTGSVVMVPDGGGPTATGDLATDGTYVMGTYSKTDGAVPGSYKVMILSLAPVGGTGLPEDTAKRGGGQTSSLIPEVFSDLSTSGLAVEIRPGENMIDFELDDKKGKVTASSK